MVLAVLVVPEDTEAHVVVELVELDREVTEVVQEELEELDKEVMVEALEAQVDKVAMDLELVVLED